MPLALAWLRGIYFPHALFQGHCPKEKLTTDLFIYSQFFLGITSWLSWEKKEGEEGGCFKRQNATRSQCFAFQNTSFCRWKILVSKVTSPNTLKSFLYKNIKRSYPKTSNKIFISYHITPFMNTLTTPQNWSCWIHHVQQMGASNGCFSPRHWDCTKFVIVLVLKASFNCNPHHSS